MTRMVSSIDILLAQRPAEPETRSILLVPIESGEAWVASKGLSRWFNEKYNCAKEKDGHEAGILAVYNTLFDKVDKYRMRSLGLATTLSEVELTDRTQRACAIASLLFGQRSQKSGWPKKSELETKKLEVYQEVINADIPTFTGMSEWGLRQAINNRKFWRWQLEQNRNHWVVPELRQAIASSTPEKVEV